MSVTPKKEMISKGEERDMKGKRLMGLGMNNSARSNGPINVQQHNIRSLDDVTS